MRSLLERYPIGSGPSGLLGFPMLDMLMDYLEVRIILNLRNEKEENGPESNPFLLLDWDSNAAKSGPLLIHTMTRGTGYAPK